MSSAWRNVNKSGARRGSDPLKAWSPVTVAEEQDLTVLVAEGGPFHNLPTLADACRRLIREELTKASHENARDRLSQLDWRSFFVEATLQRWRTPSPHPRSIETCPEFDQEVRALAPEDQAAVAEILAGIERGDDLSPLLSRWATKAHPKRADRLLADWHLHHIHIRPGSGELLFVHMDTRTARMVAVRPHESWAELELVHRVQRAWPGLIFSGFIGGVRPSRIVPDDELRALQQAGVNVILPDEQGLALMGRGITGSGHPMVLIDGANALEYRLRELEEGLVVEDATVWTPCLSEDFGALGLLNAKEERILWVARLWPFGPQTPRQSDDR